MQDFTSHPALTPFSVRITERLGTRALITMMAVGLISLAALASLAPVWVLAVLMVLVGLAGPLISPPITAVLLNSVPGYRAGTASSVYNTSRQIGGALAVAVFGVLLAQPATFLEGMRASLLIAAGVALTTAVVSFLLRDVRQDAKA